MHTAQLRRPWLGVVACLLGVLLARWSGAAEAEAPGRAVAATVFNDRAEIERESRFELPAGSSTVRFTGLTPQMERDSLRVSVAGMPVSLGAVEIVEIVAPAGASPEVEAVRAKLVQLQAERARLDARDGTASEQQKFIRTIAERSALEPRAEKALDVASIDALYRLMGTRLQELADDTLERSARRGALQEEIELAAARLATLASSGSIRTLSVSVEVESETSGMLAVRLQYMVGNASWRPAYRAMLDAATGQVSLVSEAVVRQRTGDDWSDVSLRLSTATPARGLAPPMLSATRLRVEEIVVTARKREERLASDPISIASAQDPDAQTRSELEPDLEVSRVDRDALAAQTRVERAAHSVAFRVPGRSSVAADGRDHRVPLRRIALDARLEYRVVPAANEAAFVLAHAQAPDHVLPAGPLRAYATGSYLGSFDLADTTPRSPLEIPFGIDDRIRVERIRIPLRTGSSGILGRHREAEYRFVTRIENGSSEKRTVVVEDHLPIAEDERISVALIDSTTAGWRPAEKRPGILEWSIELEPGATREIAFGYILRAPSEVVLPEL